jgi:hypothetical protein
MLWLRKKYLILWTVILLLSVSTSVFGGDPPPVGGDPTDDPGSVPIGGSAPIGDGIFLLLALAVLYLVNKFHWFKRWKRPKKQVVMGSSHRI